MAEIIIIIFTHLVAFAGGVAADRLGWLDRIWKRGGTPERRRGE